MGCDAAAVSSADDAHVWLAARRCDLVLLDLHMPDKDGYAFIAEYGEWAARQPGGARTPVIAVSAYAPDGAARAEAELFFDSLTKPVHYDVLRDAVQRALAARHGASVAG
jgi:CheY-like chemotaxis protein